MSKYKYLLFDCDDTVLDFKASERLALVKLFEMYGISPSEDVISEYIKINEKYWKLYEKHVLSRDEILNKRFEEFFSKHGIEEDCVKVNMLYLTLLTKNVVVISGIEEVLKELKKEYKLFIITNGVKWTQVERFKQTTVKDYFDYFFISEEMGAQKPDKEFFEQVIEKTGDRDLSKYLVIGDSESSDIMGGIKAGMDTCWFNRDRLKGKLHPTYEIDKVEDYLRIL